MLDVLHVILRSGHSNARLLPVTQPTDIFAYAAYFEAALDAELSGLGDFTPDLGCEDPLASLLLGTDSMMLPDSWL